MVDQMSERWKGMMVMVFYMDELARSVVTKLKFLIGPIEKAVSRYISPIKNNILLQ